ncbi:MAG: phosphate ABC transporter ATP-binding protein [Planctomycetota bacterium]|nr:MAG: phosphate ABC transporter ATP-binding protein [Planctomycetota bacterium]
MRGADLATEDLSLRYRDGTQAFAGVSLRLRAGTIVALVGPSGCGKSSLLSVFNRTSDLVPGCRVSGRARLGELDLLARDLDLPALRRRVGVLFQRPAPFPLSIRANVALALREHGFDEIEGRCERALRQVGLWDEVAGRLDAPATSLSGGQQQRLCLARALALEPEVLLLDEPCSALDPYAAGVLEDLVASLRGRATVVLVTHELAQARRLADEVALFWVHGGAGRLVEQSETERFFAAPQRPLTAAYVAGRRPSAADVEASLPAP